MTRRRTWYLLVIASVLLTNAVPSAKSEPPNPDCTDRPLAASQAELLQMAFDAASAIPPEADLSDRCKAQEAVLIACLKLQQPQRVLKWIGDIRDWRRGLVYADLAMYYARNGGEPADLQKFLHNATEIAKTAEDWRKDRIRVKIAQVHALLGNAEQAAHYEAGVEQAEQGKVAFVTSESPDADTFEKHLKELDRIARLRNFDVLRNALNSALKLFNLVYPDPERRAAVEKQIRDAMGQMPVFIRIELLLGMANSALEHEDQVQANRLAADAQTLKNASKWAVEDEIPIMARLAVHRFQTGNQQEARHDVAAALAMFDAERESILSSKRAESLVIIAQALHAMNDPSLALAVYKKSLAEAISNPNGRPRALDLSAICRSLALNAVEPDASLRNDLRNALSGLSAPW